MRLQSRWNARERWPALYCSAGRQSTTKNWKLMSSEARISSADTGRQSSDRTSSSSAGSGRVKKEDW